MRQTRRESARRSSCSFRDVSLSPSVDVKGDLSNWGRHGRRETNCFADESEREGTRGGWWVSAANSESGARGRSPPRGRGEQMARRAVRRQMTEGH